MILVLGLGNLLLGDEGVGIHALKLLEQRFVDSRINYCDGGTQGLTLLPFIEEASHILILDAVYATAAPGKIIELQEEQLNSQVPVKFSAHDIALPDLLALLRFRNGNRIRIRLLGVTPLQMEPATELSGPVRHSTDVLVERAQEILKMWLKDEGEKILCA
jgi:hydrogenase maturation protease